MRGFGVSNNVDDCRGCFRRRVLGVEDLPVYGVGCEADPPAAFDLSGRELEVLRFLCLAYSDKAIANELGISPGVVSKHLAMIFLKMDLYDSPLNSRVAAVVKALKAGLVILEDL